LGILFIGSPAFAQLSIGPTVNASIIRDEIAAVRSIVPATCDAVPAPDTAGGTMGSGNPCIARKDAARATQVIPTSALTQLDGSFSGDWPMGGFPSSPTTAFAQAKTVVAPYTCQVGMWTATTYYGKCWEQTQTIKFPGTLTELLSLTITTAKVAPAGITVSITGRQ
jgi:hypothetical protein